MWYIKELDKLELINIILPAMDKELPFQAASFPHFFSSKGSQTLAFSLLGMTVTPSTLWET